MSEVKRGICLETAKPEDTPKPIEKSASIKETDLFIEELKQSLKFREAQVAEMKVLLEQADASIDSLIKDVLLLLKKRLQ